MTRTTAIAALAIATAASSASATILTFNTYQNGAQFAFLDQSYGDNVSTDVSGSFRYQLGDEGWTPNVTASYGQVQPAVWTSGFGDLVQALYENQGDNILTVTLTADPGYNVALYDFDMALFSHTPAGINAITIHNETDFPLFDEHDITIESATRSAFDFSANPLMGSMLTITIDASNIDTSAGIDNIRFGQVLVPAPASAVTFLGLGALASRRRR